MSAPAPWWAGRQAWSPDPDDQEGEPLAGPPPPSPPPATEDPAAASSPHGDAREPTPSRSDDRSATLVPSVLRMPSVVFETVRTASAPSPRAPRAEGPPAGVSDTPLWLAPGAPRWDGGTDDRRPETYAPVERGAAGHGVVLDGSPEGTGVGAALATYPERVEDDLDEEGSSWGPPAAAASLWVGAPPTAGRSGAGTDPDRALRESWVWEGLSREQALDRPAPVARARPAPYVPAPVFFCDPDDRDVPDEEPEDDDDHEEEDEEAPQRTSKDLLHQDTSTWGAPRRDHHGDLG